MWLREIIRRWSLAFPLRNQFHPAVGYGMAIVIQAICAVLILFLLHIFPRAIHVEMPLVLGILCTALLWGTGPGLLACCVGAVLFNFFVLSPNFARNLTDGEDAMATLFFLLIGCLISLVTSRVEAARAKAVREVEELVTRLRAEQERAMVRANELAAIFEAITDSLMVYDTDERLLHCNQATNELFALEKQPDETSRVALEQMTQLQFRDTHGQLLPSEQYPQKRILRGEVLKGKQAMDVVVQSPDGHKTHLLLSGAPIHDAQKQIRGGILLAHDITQRYQLERQVEEQAIQLTSVLETVPDALFAYATNGNLLFMNTAGQALFGARANLETFLRTIEGFNICNEQGQPQPKEQWPLLRVLQGEVLTSANAGEVTVTRDGREMSLSITGGPLRARDGSIVGAVIVVRDVTERRRLEHRTQNVLEALLTMAQVVVQGEEAMDEGTQPLVQNSLRRLAVLTCSVLGCQRVSLTAIEPETEILRPLAIVGLSADLEQQWWSEQQRLSESPVPSLIQRLRDNQVSLLDMTQYPLNTLPNPRGARDVLLAPLHVGNRLIGLLALDYADYHHHYTAEEIRLAEAVAKLAALVVERERLLSEQTETRASELALREANRRMNEFLGIVAHEIRTPLTSIRANVQLAKRSLKRVTTQNVLPEETAAKIKAMQEFLDRAERQTSIQSRLVNDLVDVTRIHADQLELHLTRCDLVAIVDEAIKNQRSITPTRTIRFEKTAPGEVFVLADQDRLGQVVSNYLSNALKYSEAHRPVDVRLQPADSGSIRVSVHDEGPGLSPEQQELIWKRFYRVDEVTVKSGSSVGLGLGLYICRTIIERQGGQVGVDSQPGSGSTFWFTLPMERSPDADESSPADVI